MGTLTRAEIAAARDAGALPVLTVGAVEQHSDHLPVDTISLSAYQIALRAAARCASPHVLVLPSPAFGFSPHHRAWPGTITLSLETFNGLVTDVIESLHRTGFKRMLIINGHGGNQGPLTSTCTAMASRGIEVGFVNYMSPGQKQWLEVLPGVTRGVAHACAYETSLQMALRPAEAERIAAKVVNLPPRTGPSYAAGNAPDRIRAAGGFCRDLCCRGCRLRRRSGRLHSGGRGGDDRSHGCCVGIVPGRFCTDPIARRGAVTGRPGHRFVR